MITVTENNKSSTLDAMWRAYLRAVPTSLLTEGLTNPTLVLDSTPEFSAIYNDVDIGDTSGKYRIHGEKGSGAFLEQYTYETYCTINLSVMMEAYDQPPKTSSKTKWGKGVRSLS